MPLTPAEIQDLADQAGAALQQIQDELGRDGAGGVVRFPRHYIKTVGQRTHHFLWIGDEALKRNLCYHFLFADVLRWILNRTDLWGVARDMVVKHWIATIGAIVEGITVAAITRLAQPVGRFPGRLNRLVTAGAIDAALQTELQWVWDTRTNMHIHEVQYLEIDRYPIPEAVRASNAVRTLCDRLNAHFLNF